MSGIPSQNLREIDGIMKHLTDACESVSLAFRDKPACVYELFIQNKPFWLYRIHTFE